MVHGASFVYIEDVEIPHFTNLLAVAMDTALTCNANH